MSFKAKIVRVGTVEKGPSGRLEPFNWGFDCNGNAATIDHDENGVVICGWSVKDLQEVMARPSEFVEIL